jgi:cellulose synthase/poly-beta-1,6-N-acetylglucosamine synthase-like glycosyltransferase
MIILISKLFPEQKYKWEFKEHPTLSIIIPAYNEEKVIAEKIANTIELDWQDDKMELVIISDASSDKTDEIVKEHIPHAKRKIVFHRQNKRSGKLSALNKASELATGDLLVFTDANTHIEKNSLKKLIAPFIDPSIGCVAGEQVITTEEGSGTGEGIYWKYESKIKQAESRTGSTTGADGSLYAIKRELYPDLKTNLFLIDDLIISLSVIKNKKKIKYVPEAKAYEEGSPSLKAEFQRKARILTGSILSLGYLLTLRSFEIYTKLFFHKILRWLSPFLLILLFIVNSYLTFFRLFYAITMLGQVIFYLLASIGFFVEVFGYPQGRLTYFPLYFALTNIAEMWGFVGMITRGHKPTWEKVR